jgi:hypothetical protein
VTGGASGSGNGTVTFSVAARTLSTQRVGTLTIAGQTVTITQNGTSCIYTVSPTLRLMTSAAASSTTAVTAGTGCTWTATSNNTPWLTVTGGASGTANGTVTFAVTANTSTTQRVGTLSVAGHTVTITQSGTSCSYIVTPLSHTIPAAGGSALSTVTAGTGCAWTATSGATWLTITSGSSGSGNGSVSFTASANTTGTLRSTTLTIAGRTVVVQQAAPGPSAPSNFRMTGNQ